MATINGLRDVCTGSRVKRIMPDGKIKYQEATYWETLDKKARRQVSNGNNKKHSPDTP